MLDLQEPRAKGVLCISLMQHIEHYISIRTFVLKIEAEGLN
jgi:hypothetical protein